jgi:hypothetical protein
METDISDDPYFDPNVWLTLGLIVGNIRSDLCHDGSSIDVRFLGSPEHDAGGVCATIGWLPGKNSGISRITCCVAVGSAAVPKSEAAKCDFAAQIARAVSSEMLAVLRRKMNAIQLLTPPSEVTK